MFYFILHRTFFNRVYTIYFACASTHTRAYYHRHIHPYTFVCWVKCDISATSRTTDQNVIYIRYPRRLIELSIHKKSPNFALTLARKRFTLHVSRDFFLLNFIFGVIFDVKNMFGNFINLCAILDWHLSKMISRDYAVLPEKDKIKFESHKQPPNQKIIYTRKTHYIFMLFNHICTSTLTQQLNLTSANTQIIQKYGGVRAAMCEKNRVQNREHISYIVVSNWWKSTEKHSLEPHCIYICLTPTNISIHSFFITHQNIKNIPFRRNFFSISFCLCMRVLFASIGAHSL